MKVAKYFEVAIVVWIVTTWVAHLFADPSPETLPSWLQGLVGAIFVTTMFVIIDRLRAKSSKQ